MNEKEGLDITCNETIYKHMTAIEAIQLIRWVDRSFLNTFRTLNIFLNVGLHAFGRPDSRMAPKLLNDIEFAVILKLKDDRFYHAIMKSESSGFTTIDVSECKLTLIHKLHRLNFSVSQG